MKKSESLEESAKIAHDEILELTKTNNELRKELESYKRKSNVGKAVFSVIAFLNSIVQEEPFSRLESLRAYLIPIAQCDGKTAEEIEKIEDERVDYSFILRRPDWFITVK